MQHYTCSIRDDRNNTIPSLTRLEAASTLMPIGYFDRSQPVANLDGNLPHWRQEGVTYIVTFRLADSIPYEKLKQWMQERDEWLKTHPEPHDIPTAKLFHQLFIQRIHRWLDAGYGSCALKHPASREIVAGTLRFFVGKKYSLREWVIMPNHVHAIVTPLEGYELSEILHSWKSFTSQEINKLLSTAGTFWQKESFDQIVRNADHLERLEKYIHDNPKHLPPDTYTLGCIHQ